MNGFIVEFNGDRDWIVGEELEAWVGEWQRDEEDGALVFGERDDAVRFAEEYYAQRRRMDAGTDAADYDPNSADGIAVTVARYTLDLDTGESAEGDVLGYVDPYDGKFLEATV